MAAVVGTINYEVITGLSARLPRVYYRGEQEVGYATLVRSQ